MGNDSLWEKFCAALGFGSLAANPLYATNEGRVRRREELNAELFPALMGFTRAQLSEKLEAAGVPCGPVNNMHEVFEDPHVQARGVAVRVPHAALEETTVTSPPWRFGGQSLPVRRGPPTPGQHTAEVLAELGIERGER